MATGTYTAVSLPAPRDAGVGLLCSGEPGAWGEGKAAFCAGVNAARMLAAAVLAVSALLAHQALTNSRPPPSLWLCRRLVRAIAVGGAFGMALCGGRSACSWGRNGMSGSK